jgi:hypothetical protein
MFFGTDFYFKLQVPSKVSVYVQHSASQTLLLLSYRASIVGAQITPQVHHPTEPVTVHARDIQQINAAI